MLSAISQAALILAAISGVWSDQFPFKMIATTILMMNAAAIVLAAWLKSGE